VQRLHGLKARMLAAPDQQISLTDPDSRSMATSGRGSGVVGYNVQIAVDTEHTLLVEQSEMITYGSRSRHRILNSVPGRMQTATFTSSCAANPRAPVPKLCVVSLSPTFAGRDVTLWRLKSHIPQLRNAQPIEVQIAGPSHGVDPNQFDLP
jgi:hypothetical protein